MVAPPSLPPSPPLPRGVDLPFRQDGLLVLFAYLVLCLLLGVLGWRKRTLAAEASMHDHFLAGRAGLGPLVLLGTLFAQTLSGWSLLGYPGVAYREGLPAIKWLAASVSMYVGVLVAFPRFHRVGRPRRFLTPSDLLLARFGAGALHASTSCLLFVPTVAYVLLQFKGLGSTIHSISRGALSHSAGALLAAAVMLCYDLLGGMQTVAWTDCLQSVLMLGAFFAMFGLAMSTFGGVSHAMEELAALSPDRTATQQPYQVVEHFSSFILMLSFAFYPHQATRAFAASSGEGLRLATSVMSLHPFVSQGLCLLIGWAATPSLLGTLPPADSDAALLQVMSIVMRSSEGGYWIAVLLMAAAIAAMMSTADSALMAVSAILTNDGLSHYYWRPLSQKAMRIRTTRPGPHALCLAVTPRLSPPPQQLLLASKVLTTLVAALLVALSAMEITIVGLAALQQQILSQALPAIWGALSCEACAQLVGLLTTFALLPVTGVQGLLYGLHPGVVGLFANMATVAIVGIALVCRRTWHVRPRSFVEMMPSTDDPTSQCARSETAAGGKPQAHAAAAAQPSVGADIAVQLFGESGGRVLREPARYSLWLWVLIVTLAVLSSSFWRGAGEQDKVLLLLPAWADLCILHSLLLALVIGLSLRFLWELPGERRAQVVPVAQARAFRSACAALPSARGCVPQAVVSRGSSGSSEQPPAGQPSQPPPGDISPSTRRIFEMGRRVTASNAALALKDARSHGERRGRTTSGSGGRLFKCASSSACDDPAVASTIEMTSNEKSQMSQLGQPASTSSTRTPARV
ncbi:hypothetical protein AB1Y20_020826 [Prymnesium parvum]|uniref:Sodium/solute symporter n=1 Tax=Prymnesium parvum TaxID=97485 RepID=A0AB34JYJ3_PRYPA